MYSEGVRDDDADSLHGWKIEDWPECFAHAVQVTTTRACERQICSGEGLIDVRPLGLLSMLVGIHGLARFALSALFFTW
jgi:hypothetical protein